MLLFHLSASFIGHSLMCTKPEYVNRNLEMAYIYLTTVVLRTSNTYTSPLPHEQHEMLSRTRLERDYTRSGRTITIHVRTRTGRSILISCPITERITQPCIMLHQNEKYAKHTAARAPVDACGTHLAGRAPDIQLAAAHDTTLQAARMAD